MLFGTFLSLLREFSLPLFSLLVFVIICQCGTLPSIGPFLLYFPSFMQLLIVISSLLWPSAYWMIAVRRAGPDYISYFSSFLHLFWLTALRKEQEVNMYVYWEWIDFYTHLSTYIICRCIWGLFVHLNLLGFFYNLTFVYYFCHYHCTVHSFRVTVLSEFSCNSSLLFLKLWCVFFFFFSFSFF